MRLLFLIIAWLSLPLPAAAQTPGPSSDAAAAAEIDKAGAHLHDIAPGPHSASLSDDELRARLADIPPIQASLTAALGPLTARLRDVDARLAQLGPPPAAGQPEPAETAATRKALLLMRGTLDGQVKEGKLLTVVAAQTGAALGDQLRQNLQTRLWTRSRSVLDPDLFGSLGAALPQMGERVAAIADSQAAAIAKAAHRWQGALSLAAGVLVALFLLFPAKPLLDRLGYQRRTPDASPTRLRQSSLALWSVLVAILRPVLALFALRAGLEGAGALRPDFDVVLLEIIRAVAAVAALHSLGRALLSPGHSAWRLAPLPDGLVARLAPFPLLIALTGGLALFVSHLDAALGGIIATSVAGERVTVTLEIAAVGAALWTATRWHAAPVAESPDAAARSGESRVPWVLATLAAWLALVVALGAVLLGYLALATLLMRETIWIAAVLGMLFLALLFFDDVFSAVLSRSTRLGRLLRDGLGTADESIEHFAVLLSGASRLAVLAAGWALILLPAGASPGDLVARVTTGQAVIKIGQVSVSPGAIVGSIVLFAIGMFATRATRGWLENRYLPKTRMDVGVRTSVSALFSYLGVAIALVLAFAYLGLSFSQITLFASALSVGIGFGLQSIISNFVSGLILLVERPVKVGDWVAIGDLQGDVKAINIRATEINMLDRSLLIVPNSDLVTKAVRNVTHGAPWAG